MNLADPSVTVHLADTPASWPDPPPMSTLEAMLLFVGVPALIIVVITLLVMAPSLAKGPRYRPSQQWDADAEWFGAPVEGGPADQKALASSASPQADHDADDAGGASASW